MKYILLLENDKGKRNWLETIDLSIWKNPVVGSVVFYDKKIWFVKSIISMS